jgi:DNA-binding NarL/FixJ family response regulator
MHPESLRAVPPAAQGGGPPSGPPSGPPHGLPHRRGTGAPPRILLIDAAPERRQGLRLLLEDAHMTVFDTASGTEALALAGIVKPDVAVIDLRVPGCDGLALTQQLRRRLPGLTVLLHSTADRAALLPAALRAGALDVVNGSIEPAGMVEAIREAVGIGRTAAHVAARTTRPA